MTVRNHEDPALPEALDAASEKLMEQLPTAPVKLPVLERLKASAKPVPLRWRKQPNAEGGWRQRMMQNPRGWDLCAGDTVLAWVRPIMDVRLIKGWYWAAEGVSSASNPGTLEDAKAQALAHTQAQRGQQKAEGH